LACLTRIEKALVLARYSRPGNPYDNAQAEAASSTLKTESLPNGGTFASLEAARLEVTFYLDTYFNLVRCHSALGYRLPHQFDRNCLTSLP
jgi:putative transposase